MDVREAIKKRRCVRAWESKPVRREEIVDLIDLAIQAPSAGNMQDWEFILVEDVEQKEKIAQACYQSFVAKAPWIVVICTNLEKAEMAYGERGVHLYSIQDTAACAENFLLGALEKGLEGCWIGAFDEESISEILRLPSKIRPVIIIPIGHGVGGPKPSREKPKIFFDVYGEKQEDLQKG
jgi:nitroreductase